MEHAEQPLPITCDDPQLEGLARSVWGYVQDARTLEELRNVRANIDQIIGSGRYESPPPMPDTFNALTRRKVRREQERVAVRTRALLAVDRLFAHRSAAIQKLGAPGAN